MTALTLTRTDGNLSEKVPDQIKQELIYLPGACTGQNGLSYNNLTI